MLRFFLVKPFGPPLQVEICQTQLLVIIVFQVLFFRRVTRPWIRQRGALRVAWRTHHGQILRRFCRLLAKHRLEWTARIFAFFLKWHVIALLLAFISEVEGEGRWLLVTELR